MQYLLSLAVPPLLFVLARRQLLRWSLMRLAVTSTVLTYAATVSAAFAISAWYGWQYERFDTNHDGVIGLQEQSLAQAQAESLATNDAGRNLSVFLALPWSILMSATFFGVVALARRSSAESELPSTIRSSSTRASAAHGGERDA